MQEENQNPRIKVPDAAVALGVQAVAQPFNAQVQSIMQLWGMASKIVAAKSPQPQIDPAVQKTFEAAMAETQRRAQLDQMNSQQAQRDFALKQSDQQFNQQQVIQQMRDQAQQAQLSFQKELHEFAQGMQQAQAELQATIKKNSDDFLIKLMTLENANQKLQAEIETKDREHAAKIAEAMSANQVDLTPHVKQMQDMLGQMKDNRSSEAMDALMSGMHGILQHLAAPSKLELIKDENGKTVGAVKSSIQTINTQ